MTPYETRTARLAALLQTLSQTAPDFDTRHVRVLLSVGELHLCVETLVDNLYECRVVLDDQSRSTLIEVCRGLGLDELYRAYFPD